MGLPSYCHGPFWVPASNFVVPVQYQASVNSSPSHHRVGFDDATLSVLQLVCFKRNWVTCIEQVDEDRTRTPEGHAVHHPYKPSR